MIIAEQLHIVNIQSVSDVVFIFPDNKPRLIQGDNKDDTDQDSNGSGKSTPLEGIRFALTGETFKGVVLDEFLRDFTDQGYVELTLQNHFLDQKIEIKRLIVRGSPQRVQLLINGQAEMHPSVDAYNKRILELLGVSKDDLINYFLIHKDKFKPFFLTGDSDKKKIIGRFSGASMVEGIDKLIEADIKSLETEIVALKIDLVGFKKDFEFAQVQLDALLKFDIEPELKKLTENNDQITNSLEELRDSLSGKMKVKTDVLTKQAARLLKVSAKYNSDLLSITDTQLREAEKTATKLNDDLVDIIEDIKNVQKAKNKDINTYSREIQLIENKIAGLIECPHCKHKFSLQEKNFNLMQAKVDIDFIQSSIKKLQKEIEGSDGDIKEVEEGLAEAQSDLLKIKTEIQGLDSKKALVKAKLDRVNQINKNLLSQTKNHQQEINLKTGKIKSLETQIVDNKIKYDELIKTDNNQKKWDLEKQIEVLRTKIYNLEVLIWKKEDNKKELSEWVIHFKGFNTWLANQTIKLIEGYTNNVLVEMGSTLSLDIDGYRTLADGKTVREEISEKIYRNGIELGTFKRFSGGEKGKLVVANIIALHRLINLNSPTGGFGYLCLDEVLESIDATGIKGIIKGLETLKMPIDLITHSKHDYKNIETVLVVKESGESTLIYN